VAKRSKPRCVDSKTGFPGRYLLETFHWHLGQLRQHLSRSQRLQGTFLGGEGFRIVSIIVVVLSIFKFMLMEKPFSSENNVMLWHCAGNATSHLCLSTHTKAQTSQAPQTQ